MSNHATGTIGSFIKGSSFLVLSNVCLKAINFFLLPLYTKNLTPEMIGISDSITTFTGILFPILVMGLDSAFSAFYFDKDDSNRSEKVFSTLTRVFILIGFIPILLFPLSPFLSTLLFKTKEYAYIVAFSLASVSFNLWYLPFSLELRLENKMMLFGLSNVIASLSMVLLNILFVSIMHFGAASLVLSMALVHVEMTLVLVLMVRKKPHKEYFDKHLLKEMIRFALPLIPMTVMVWILTLSDRYVLLYFHGSEAVGLYGIGLRFTNLLNVVISAVAMAYTTFAFGSKDDENAKKKYYYIFNVESFFLLAFSFTVALFGSQIINLMTSEAYWTAYKPLRDLMFAQSVYAMTTIVGYGIYFQKKSVLSLIAVTVGAALNLGLNFVLIPKYGIAAAALTTLIGYVTYYVLVLLFSKRVYPCDYGEIRVGIVTVFLYFVCMFTEEWPLQYKLVVWFVCAFVVIFVFRKVFSFVISFAKRNMSKSEDLK